MRFQLMWWALLFVTLGLLPGCSALFPKNLSMTERLANFPKENLPLENPVTIRWNEFQVPFIEAQSDRDLAFTLGLVHAHLRLSQITLLKRAAYGRLSESIGPFAADIDYTLRIIDFTKSAPETVKRMPPQTKEWLQGFVDGLNHYQETVDRLPPEFGLMGLETEPWRVEDIVSMGRVAGTDVNWLAYFSLLGQRSKNEWPDIIARALETGLNPVFSFKSTPEQAMLNQLIAGMSKSGSNSYAVAPDKSASGAAMIASDPHLGLFLPNLWVLVGFKSPSYNAVGYTIPGVPIVGIGRTPDMAWGGTNLRAAVSDFYDVSKLEPAVIEETQTEIKKRFWGSDTRTVRQSKLGPIISDSPLIESKPDEVLALRWIGHEPTDEITALLEAMKAKTPEQFRQAFAPFAISAQNMVFADKTGNIGQIIATTLPIREKGPTTDIVFDATDPAYAWQGFLSAPTLPYVTNPAEEYIASANNVPTKTSPPIGFFFSSDDRIKRLQDALGSMEQISLEDLMELQRDTKSPDAQQINQGFVRLVRDLDFSDNAKKLIAELEAWDGDYDAQSWAPVVFESVLNALLPALYDVETAAELPIYQQQWNYMATHLVRDLAEKPTEKRQDIVSRALEKAFETASQFKRWGDMHRLQAGHLLANAPVIGRNFVVGNFPIGGSRETLMKTAHDLVSDEHTARYGSQARHVSDMSDIDENYFLMFGGEDGWLGSANYDDQLEKWVEGSYIKMPLRDDSVKAAFSTSMELSPNN